MAQDDYYYEIQLTNKQLVFYFTAGAAGLILSFLAGVMVGRGVEGGPASVPEARPVADERIVAEQSPSPATATPAPANFSYPQRLESDRVEEGLEKSRPAGAATPAPPPPAAARPSPTPAAARPAATKAPPATPAVAPTATPAPAATLPTPRPVATPAVAPRPAAATGALPKPLASSAKGFAIQVGAFKDKATADGVVTNLKGRGLPAYAVPPAGGGLFTVRVGVYRDRADAEAVQDRLRDDKFKPYIVKQ
ncbi:MAG TPA: SPOR domain-containing protein [Vicinamibacteria bacterium]|nr:SPOR domain-containing protein [Vicinamibacteria bacterium]